MTYIAKEWNEKQSKLKEFLTTEKTFDKGIELLLEMHGLLHDKKIYKNIVETYYNTLWGDLKEETCKIISSKETSILWNIWHITRIEDIVANVLIGDKEEIFNTEIQTNLKIRIKDTGNAMAYSEIELFNNNVNIKALNDYRIKVGKQTTKIIKGLKYADMKRKVKKEQLEKIKQNGGVLDTEKSIWLLDFWGKKNIFGLIMMPITRHQIVHLNDCLIIKKKYNK
jgi:hypothetical protein